MGNITAHQDDQTAPVFRIGKVAPATYDQATGRVTPRAFDAIPDGQLEALADRHFTWAAAVEGLPPYNRLAAVDDGSYWLIEAIELEGI